MSATATATVKTSSQHRVPATGNANANTATPTDTKPSGNGSVSQVSQPSQTQTSGPEHANASLSPLDATEVAWLFIKKYYTILNENPNILPQFYRKQSILCHGVEGKSVPSYTGQSQIANRLKEHNFQDCRVLISNMDCQESINGGVVIQVLGEMANNGRPSQKFSQTFFLAPQEPHGYFVLNDIFRFLKEDVEEDEADFTPAQAQQQQQHNTSQPPQIAETQVQANGHVNGHANGQAESQGTKPAESKQEVKPETVKKPEQPKAETAPNSVPSSKTTTPVAVESTKKEADSKVANAPTEPKAPTAPAASKKTEEPASTSTSTAKTPTASSAPAPSLSWASIAKKKEGETTTTGAGSTASAAASAAKPVSAPVITSTPAASRPKPLQNSNIVVTTRPGQVPGNGRKEYHSAYIRDVNHKVDENLLRKGLESIGQLTHFQVEKEKNRAFVDFVDAATLKAALGVHELKVGDQVVFIEERKRGGGKKNGQKKVYKNKP